MPLKIKDTLTQKPKKEPARATEKQGSKSRATKEINGPKGPEPTRYGDWEKNGIISDF